MRRGRSVRRRTTLAAVQEAVAQAKAVGTTGVTVVVALHQAVVEQAHWRRVSALRQNGALGT
jgi:hypothetical protein